MKIHVQKNKNKNKKPVSCILVFLGHSKLKYISSQFKKNF